METFRSGKFEVLIHNSLVYYRFEYDDDKEFPYAWRVLTHDGLIIVDEGVEELEKTFQLNCKE